MTKLTKVIKLLKIIKGSIDTNMTNLTKLDQILEILDQTYLNIDKTKPNVNKNQIPPKLINNPNDKK